VHSHVVYNVSQQKFSSEVIYQQLRISKVDNVIVILFVYLYRW